MKLAKLVAYLGLIFGSNIDGILNVNAQNKGDLNRTKTTYVLYNHDITNPTNHDLYRALANNTKVPENRLKIFSKEGRFIENDKNFTSGLEVGINFEIIPVAISSDDYIRPEGDFSNINLVTLEQNLVKYAMNYDEFVNMNLNDKILRLAYLKENIPGKDETVEELVEHVMLRNTILFLVRDLLGNIYNVNLNYQIGKTTGKQIYDAIGNKMKKPAEQIRLVFGNTIVPNDDTPCNIEFAKESVLRVVLIPARGTDLKTDHWLEDEEAAPAPEKEVDSDASLAAADLVFDENNLVSVEQALKGVFNVKYVTLLNNDFIAKKDLLKRFIGYQKDGDTDAILTIISANEY